MNAVKPVATESVPEGGAGFFEAKDLLGDSDFRVPSSLLSLHLPLQLILLVAIAAGAPRWEQLGHFPVKPVLPFGGIGRWNREQWLDPGINQRNRRSDPSQW